VPEGAPGNSGSSDEPAAAEAASIVMRSFSSLKAAAPSVARTCSHIAYRLTVAGLVSWSPTHLQNTRMDGLTTICQAGSGDSPTQATKTKTSREWGTQRRTGVRRDNRAGARRSTWLTSEPGAPLAIGGR
jgi:hypothetical protein